MRDAVERAAAAAGVQVTCIGRIVEGECIRARTAHGVSWSPGITGYRHFRA
jgi:thiamine monophosphate kinase